MAVVAAAGGHRGSGIAEGVNRDGVLEEGHGFVALERRLEMEEGRGKMATLD